MPEVLATVVSLAPADGVETSATQHNKLTIEETVAPEPSSLGISEIAMSLY